MERSDSRNGEAASSVESLSLDARRRLVVIRDNAQHLSPRASTGYRRGRPFPLLPPAQNRQQSHEKKDLLAFSSGVAGLRDRPLLSASVRRRPEHQPLSILARRPHHNSARIVQLTLLITVLSLAPSILVMVTCFTRIVVGTVLHPNSHRRATNAAEHRSYQSGPLYDAVRHAARCRKSVGRRPEALMNGEMDEETSFTRTAEPFTGSCSKTRASRTSTFSGAGQNRYKPRHARRQGTQDKTYLSAPLFHDFRTAAGL